MPQKIREKTKERERNPREFKKIGKKKKFIYENNLKSDFS